MLNVKLFLSTLCILFIVGAVPFSDSVVSLSDPEKVYFLCVLNLLVVLWIFYTVRHIDPDRFNLYNLFMLSAVSFNGGQVYLELFHLNKEGILNGVFNATILIKTVYLVALSLASFHAGAMFLVLKKQHHKKSSTNLYSDSISDETLRIVGFVLVVISIGPTFLLTMETVKIVLENGYFAIFQQDQSAGVGAGMEGVKKNLYGFYPAGLLYLLAGSSKQKILRNIVLCAIFMQFCTFMFIGQRNIGIMIFLAGLWVYHKVIRKIPIYRLIIIGTMILFVIFPTIRLIRDIEGSSRLSFQMILDAYFSMQNPTLSSIQEMGGSMGTIAYTLMLVPQVRPFAWGTTYLYAATTFLPNLFWDVHPAIAYGNLDRWLTMTVAPNLYYEGGGLGYSFIGEAYTNFGWWGTPILMAVLGFIIANLTRWAAGTQDHRKIALVSCCIAFILFWPRADLTIFSRNVYYHILFPYLFFIMLRRELYRRRKLETHENTVCP